MTDGWTDGWLDVGNFYPFYMTSSLIGAAASFPKERFRPIKRSKARESLTL